MRRPPAAIRIDPGQKAERCQYCAQVIYWGEHPSTHKRHPVSINGKYLSDARPPTHDRAGAGISHWVDCPNKPSRTPRPAQPELLA